MRILRPGLKYYLDRITSGAPYSFIRYGDGEWSAAILQDRQRTGSGSQALDIPTLQRGMRRSLQRIPNQENYLVSLRPGSLDKDRRISRWLAGNVPKYVQWHDCRVFAHASKGGELYPLISTLRNLNIPLVFLGPPWLQKLRSVFPAAYIATYSTRDTFKDSRRISMQVLSLPRPVLVSFSVGPATKILIHALHPLVGRKMFLIDFGSLWDVFAGRRDRTYQRTMTPETLQRNLHG